LDIKSRQVTIVIAILLVIAVLAVYWQVQNYSFIRFDEEVYVTKNLQVQKGLSYEGLRFAFASSDAGFWHPLTWLSLMLDYQLFRNNAGGYHWTNLLLHLTNTLLLFIILQRMTSAPWRSGFVAALFALHPLHVEPVAWIAARKDVISAFFWMLTMGAYVLYAERPILSRYLAVLFFFALGLMAKPMVVTLPFILLLLDYWPLHGFYQKGKHSGAEQPARLPDGEERSRAPGYFLLLEKVPLLIMSGVVGLSTVFAEGKAGALVSLDSLPFAVRLENALSSYADYLVKMFRPTGLAVFYPHPGHVPLLKVALSLLLLLIISFAALKWAKRLPYLAVGWLWYVITLLPVSGLIQVGSHAMADRYTYIPLVGVFIALSWGVSECVFNRRKIIISLFALVAILSMMFLSRHQVSFWRDSETLFLHAVSVASGNYLAHNNLGAVLMEKGDMEGAIHHYRQALETKPKYAAAHNNLGSALAVKGDYAGARLHFAEALSCKPDYGNAHRNLADLLMRQGEVDEAIVHYRRALFLLALDPELHNNAGVALAVKGNIAGAVRHFRLALKLKPDFGEAKDNLARLAGDMNPRKDGGNR
jgi:Flp pilus assembly protein TadD